MYREIVDLTGDRAALRDQVRLLAARGDASLVRRALDEAIRRAPSGRARAGALLTRGERWLHMGEFKKARADFEAAESLSPGLLPVLAGLLRCVSDAERSTIAERLRSALAPMARRTPDRLEALRVLAHVAEESLRNPRLAQWAWSEVLAESPDSEQARVQLTALARRLGDTTVLSQLLRAQLVQESRGPSARQARLELVATLEAKGDADAALDELRQAVRYEPGHKDAWLMLVERLLQREHLGEAAWALEHAATATEDEEEREQTWDRLARLWREVLGNPERAQIYARRAEGLRQAREERELPPPEPPRSATPRREPSGPRAPLVPAPPALMHAPANVEHLASEVTSTTDPGAAVAAMIPSGPESRGPASLPGNVQAPAPRNPASEPGNAPAPAPRNPAPSGGSAGSASRNAASAPGNAQAPVPRNPASASGNAAAPAPRNPPSAPGNAPAPAPRNPASASGNAAAPVPRNPASVPGNAPAPAPRNPAAASGSAAAPAPRNPASVPGNAPAPAPRNPASVAGNAPAPAPRNPASVPGNATAPAPRNPASVSGTAPAPAPRNPASVPGNAPAPAPRDPASAAGNAPVPAPRNPASEPGNASASAPRASGGGEGGPGASAPRDPSSAPGNASAPRPRNPASVPGNKPAPAPHAPAASGDNADAAGFPPSPAPRNPASAPGNKPAPAPRAPAASSDNADAAGFPPSPAPRNPASAPGNKPAPAPRAPADTADASGFPPAAAAPRAPAPSRRERASARAASPGRDAEPAARQGTDEQSPQRAGAIDLITGEVLDLNAPSVPETRVISWEAPPGRMDPVRRVVRGARPEGTMAAPAPGRTFIAKPPAPPEPPKPAPGAAEPRESAAPAPAPAYLPAQDTEPDGFRHIRERPLEAAPYRALAEYFDQRGDPDRASLMREIADALDGLETPAPKGQRPPLTSDERAGLRHPGLRTPSGELLACTGIALCRLFPAEGRAAGSSELLRATAGPAAPDVLDALHTAARMLDVHLPELVLAEDDGPPFTAVHAGHPRLLVGRLLLRESMPAPELRFHAGRALLSLSPDLLALRALKGRQLFRALALLSTVLKDPRATGEEARVVRESLSPKALERAVALLEPGTQNFKASALADAARDSANRAGLVACGSMGPALTVLRARRDNEAELVELLRFAASERYLPLRAPR
ncbi:D-alanyl-D-alanine carboxypeptidase [Myxococcus hansupus]|uniref:D-alanyl-D-alanine carboxypeptidase n=1 Tax=Pseudomyxococcus hansupus TaxID=1297742 RepID=A0A0H4X443_9BACT|nr:D-alanyl-D-alanine carboxypeptidase [Myxococcus hansupus]